jgi:prepilin-type processing-associated H-X9-DG protein
MLRVPVMFVSSRVGRRPKWGVIFGGLRAQPLCATVSRLGGSIPRGSVLFVDGHEVAVDRGKWISRKLVHIPELPVETPREVSLSLPNGEVIPLLFAD